MSQENVEAFKRGMAAAERRDVDAVPAELDVEVEWQPVLPVLLGGKATMYRGHQGVRELFREMYAAFAEFQSRSPRFERPWRSTYRWRPDARAAR